MPPKRAKKSGSRSPEEVRLSLPPDALEIDVFPTQSPERRQRGGGGGGGSSSSRSRQPRAARSTHPPPLSPTPRVLHRPYFCALAFAANVIVFMFEMRANDWKLQPLQCEATCADGRPCYGDGRPCEANLMLGPKISVMEQLGAKKDTAIFEEGEGWRILTCNWLHAGLVHLLFNCGAIWQIGASIERAFGFWRVAVLYILAGWFGTIVSIVFLPGVLSVGASASVFGLVGACWADVLINFCARFTLRGSGWCGLLLATVLNLLFGFTPWVDNFMHLGGMVAGLVIGLALFARKRTDARTGVRGRTATQETCTLVAVALTFVLVIFAIAAMGSDALRNSFRECGACRRFNCLPTPWWSCCLSAARGGTCSVHEFNASQVTVMCNMTGLAPFSAMCSVDDDPVGCAYTNNDRDATTRICRALCFEGLDC